MQNRFVIIDDIGTERDFTPYNYNEIKIVDKRSTLTRAWMWDKHIDDIEILGADYDYVYNLINTNKCVDYYIKWYCDGALKYYGYFNYYSCDIDKDGCKMSIKSEEYNAAYKYFLLRYKQEFNLSEHTAQIPYCDTVVSLPFAWLLLEKRNGQLISDILNFLADRCGLTVSSKFLNDAICPISVLPGDLDIPYNNEDTSAVNLYKTLMLVNSKVGSDIITSLSEILTALCEQYFNLYWHIDHTTNTLHIEHALYYRNNNSYTINNTVGVDLTTINGGIYVTDTDKYSIDGNDINYLKSWTPNYPHRNLPPTLYGSGTFGWKLYYECIPNMNNSVVYGQLYDTHVRLIMDESIDSVMLCATYIDSLARYQVYYKQIAGTNYHINYPFETNFGWYLWKWGADTPIAYNDLNKPPKTMASTKPTITQVDIEFPLCCDNLDLNKLVRTNLGDGMIDEASLSISTGMCTLKLKYADI
jgi:hypothetical protein